MTAVSTAPNKGTDKFASITGPAKLHILLRCADLSDSVKLEIVFLSFNCLKCLPNYNYRSSSFYTES